ncbi:MAG: hypothetical protein APF84_01050 [Gracilibacter sp. BRH_c7a]|nr:MAG: hypothetical protein APF84_01050 [Gracilibacter sp. BRH_c7a]
MEKKKPQIIFSETGPYEVRNVENLANSKGEQLSVKPVMNLCRCGNSGNKPYCDCSHIESGFKNDTNPDDDTNRWKEYTGKDILVYFNLSVCSHSAICLRKLPEVFNLKKRPWVNPDGADYRRVMQVIEECPSGALSYSVNGKMYEPPARAAKITVYRGGEYNIEGGIELSGDNDPTPADSERYSLCSCGNTKHTPFCDGTHWHIKKK